MRLTHIGATTHRSACCSRRPAPDRSSAASLPVVPVRLIATHLTAPTRSPPPQGYLRRHVLRPASSPPLRPPLGTSRLPPRGYALWSTALSPRVTHYQGYGPEYRPAAPSLSAYRRASNPSRLRTCDIASQGLLISTAHSGVLLRLVGRTAWRNPPATARRSKAPPCSSAASNRAHARK